MLSVISVINMLRGFLIFLIFICKASVWRKIEKKYPKFARITQLPKRLFMCSRPNLNHNKVDGEGEAETIPMTGNQVINTEAINETNNETDHKANEDANNEADNEADNKANEDANNEADNEAKNDADKAVDNEAKDF